MNNKQRQVMGTPEIYGQGTTEAVVYIFDFQNIIGDSGSTPTTPTCKVFNVKTGVDTSATNLSGPATAIDGTKVVCTPLISLVADTQYRLVAGMTLGSQVFTLYKDIMGEL
jgi:hypothetical protein